MDFFAVSFSCRHSVAELKFAYQEGNNSLLYFHSNDIDSWKTFNYLGGKAINIMVIKNPPNKVGGQLVYITTQHV